MDTTTAQTRTSPLVYSREELLALKKSKPGLWRDVPSELRRPYRGCKAGAKLKAWLADTRRHQKPSLPSVIIGNVNSLPNKIDELAALENQQIYRECSLFILMETWLTDSIPNTQVDLRGFTVVRVDMDTKACGKSKGGGGDSSSTSTTVGVTLAMSPLRWFCVPQIWSYSPLACGHTICRGSSVT